MVLNVGLVRAESIDQLLVETIERGQSAMIRMQERFKRGLSLGWDAEGLQVMPDALDVCEEISDKSSAMQLTDAIHEAFRRITDGEILGVRK
jgi:hypothetical protein